MAYADMSQLSGTSDDDLDFCSHQELIEEIRLFRKALRYCLDQQGDDNCWMDYRHLLMRFLPGYNPATDDVTLDVEQKRELQEFHPVLAAGQGLGMPGGRQGEDGLRSIDRHAGLYHDGGKEAVSDIGIAGPKEIEAMRRDSTNRFPEIFDGIVNLEHLRVPECLIEDIASIDSPENNLIRRLIAGGCVEANSLCCFWCGNQLDDRFRGNIMLRDESRDMHKPNCPYVAAKDLLGGKP